MYCSSEKGFTLVEVMIVVGIIAVLSAIALPQFNEYRARSSDAAAQSDVKNAMQAFAVSIRR